MLSIIIPAHNEEAVIARGLRAIVAGAEPGELEVIVACNGCTDNTVEIANGFGPPVRVITVAKASKIAALNSADELASGFPRFYIDADVVIELDSIRIIAEKLRKDGVLMATPIPHMNLIGSSRPVRYYYSIWLRLPYNRMHGAVGTGVYALSERGRSRFSRFPDVISDDGFVRFLFSPAERLTVPAAVSRVDAPRTLSGLLQIKTRSRVGLYDLRMRFPDSAISDPRPRGGILAWLARRPRLWLAGVCYAWIQWRARRLAKRVRFSEVAYEWARDDSREAPLE